MKKNFVKDWMQANPVSVDVSTIVPDALQLLKKYNIRRLPVLENNKLVGMITRGDLREAGPSDATSLSIYELNYLISKLQVSEIMSSAILDISPDATLYDAAKLMLENKIGGLPVIDESKLVGIITESDIFRAFMELLEN